VVRLLSLFRPSGNLDLDLPQIQALFSHTHGLRERPGQ